MPSKGSAQVKDLSVKVSVRDSGTFPSSLSCAFYYNRNPGF